MPLETPDLQTIGAHAGSGLLGAVLAFFGVKGRLDVQDQKIAEQTNRIDEQAKRMDTLSESVLYKDVHEACSRSSHEQFVQLNNKMDLLLKEIMRRHP